MLQIRYPVLPIVLPDSLLLIVPFFQIGPHTYHSQPSDAKQLCSWLSCNKQTSEIYDEDRWAPSLKVIPFQFHVCHHISCSLHNTAFTTQSLTQGHKASILQLAVSSHWSNRAKQLEPLVREQINTNSLAWGKAQKKWSPTSYKTSTAVVQITYEYGLFNGIFNNLECVASKRAIVKNELEGWGSKRPWLRLRSCQSTSSQPIDSREHYNRTSSFVQNETTEVCDLQPQPL